MCSGEEILELTDFKLSSPVPLRWIRSYRSSQINEDVGLGFGWRSNFHIQIHQESSTKEDKESSTEEEPDERESPQPRKVKSDGGNEDDVKISRFVLINEEGRRIVFAGVEPGGKSVQLTENLELRHNRDELLLIHPDKTHWGFISNGGQWLLDYISDRMGNSLNLSYKKNNKIKRITYNKVRAIDFDYDKQDHITQIAIVELDQEKAKRLPGGVQGLLPIRQIR